MLATFDVKNIIINTSKIVKKQKKIWPLEFEF